MPLEFLPHPDIRIQVDHIGQDKAPVIVVDNFTDQPEALRAYAAGAAQFAPAQRAFPGLIAAFPLPYAQKAFGFLTPLVREVFGFTGAIVGGGASLQVVTQSADRLHPRQLTPHTDCASAEMIATVHYLCPPGFAGTSFYRHNRTGFEIVTTDRTQAYETALAEDLAQHPPQDFISADTPIFTRISQFDAVFNRIILFRGASLHAGAGGDADTTSDPAAGRLTANMFVQFQG